MVGQKTVVLARPRAGFPHQARGITTISPGVTASDGPHVSPAFAGCDINDQAFETNPYQPSATEDLSEDALLVEATERRERKRALIWLYGGVTLWGLLTGLLLENAVVYYFFGFANAFIATNWLAIDCRHHDRSVHPVARLLFFIFWPIASFFYLLWTRRLAGLGWWLLNAVGLAGAYLLMGTFGLMVAVALRWVHLP